MRVLWSAQDWGFLTRNLLRGIGLQNSFYFSKSLRSFVHVDNADRAWRRSTCSYLLTLFIQIIRLSSQSSPFVTLAVYLDLYPIQAVNVDGFILYLA